MHQCQWFQLVSLLRWSFPLMMRTVRPDWNSGFLISLSAHLAGQVHCGCSSTVENIPARTPGKLDSDPCSPWSQIRQVDISHLDLCSVAFPSLGPCWWGPGTVLRWMCALILWSYCPCHSPWCTCLLRAHQWALLPQKVMHIHACAVFYCFCGCGSELWVRLWSFV